MTGIPPSELRTVKVVRRPAVGAPVLLDQFYYNTQAGWPAPKQEWFEAEQPLTFIDIGPTEELDRHYEALPPRVEGERWDMDPELRRQLDASRVTDVDLLFPPHILAAARAGGDTMRARLEEARQVVADILAEPAVCSTCRWFEHWQTPEGHGACARITSRPDDPVALSDRDAAVLIRRPDEFGCTLWEAKTDG
jgi:hypothetical protein